MNERAYRPQAERIRRRPTATARRAVEPRPRNIRRRLTVLLLALIALPLIGLVLVGIRATAFNSTVSSRSVLTPALLFPLIGGDRVNVLLIGYGGEDHGGRYLADSINIWSIDLGSDTTTVVPIPRDLWIEGQPQLPNNGKINEAFALAFEAGGVEPAGDVLAELVTAVTGLEIDGWMAIDFAGFREMVDAVGGVTIENPTPFAYTWLEQNFQAGIWDGGEFGSGTLHLDGRQALDYARVRYASVPSEASDFARSVRQQRIMAALKVEVGEAGVLNPGPGLRLMDALENRLDTDLNVADLFLIGGHLNADRRIELTEDVILEATRNSIGQYVLTVIGRSHAADYAPLRAWLTRRLAEPTEPAPQVQ